MSSLKTIPTMTFLNLFLPSHFNHNNLPKYTGFKKNNQNNYSRKFISYSLLLTTQKSLLKHSEGHKVFIKNILLCIQAL